MRIGDEVFVHGYIDEIRKDTVIIRNDGGYFGTVPDEIKITESYTLSKDEVDNLMSDLQKGDDLLTDDDLRQLINDGINKCKEEHTYTPKYSLCKECEEKRKAGIMTPVEIARLVAGEYDKHDTEQDKVTQWIKDNAVFIKDMARLVAGEKKIIKCKDCAYFKGSDRYCSVLQINFIPEDFACNQGELNGLVE